MGSGGGPVDLPTAPVSQPSPTRRQCPTTRPRASQAVEVENDTAMRPPHPVAIDAEVADLAVGASGEPGQAALDHGPPSPVQRLSASSGGLGSGGGDHAVVRVKDYEPTSLGCSAAGPQGGQLGAVWCRSWPGPWRSRGQRDPGRADEECSDVVLLEMIR